MKNAQVLFLCLTWWMTSAQTAPNAWLVPGRQYAKFPVYREGIYRIDSAALAGVFNLTGIDPSAMQLVLNGREEPLYVSGGGDNAINAGDYIEFYASNYMANVDSMAYTAIGYVPNPYEHLFNDTIFAFLSVNPNAANLRYTSLSDTAVSAWPAADHFYSEQVYASKYGFNIGNEYYQGNVSDPHYTQAEGPGIPVAGGTSFTAPFPPLSLMPSPLLSARWLVHYSGNSRNESGAVDHHVITSYADNSGNDVVLKDTAFAGFAGVRQSFTVSSQTLGNSSALKLTALNSPSFAFSGDIMLHCVSLFYPHSLSMGGATGMRLYHDYTGTGKTGYSLQNAAGSSFILYDRTALTRHAVNSGGGSVQFVIPNTSARQLCYLAAASDSGQVIRVRKLSPVRNQVFTDFSQAPASAFVIVYHDALESGAQSYATYRSSPAGGSHPVLLANVAELYEQFSMGVNKHPAAIRNFLQFLARRSVAPPAYVFLMGKSISPIIGSPSHPDNMVPTFGLLPADNLFVTALTGTLQYAPEIPLGRLAARTNSEVALYLQKVQANEAAPAAEWKKRVLHFAGGDDAQLSAVISNYMKTYEAIVRDTLFGAEVFTFRKNTSAPIQVVISDSIRNMIREGAALIDVFGHGSSSGFDQSIDNVEEYENTGRYPFVLANSCYSGDIHNFLRSVSERFVLTKDRGSIGFMATTSLGFDYSLNNYSRHFYTALAATRYGQGIGDIVKEAAIRNSNELDLLTDFVGLDMTLHGDPAVKVWNGPQPDYRVAPGDLRLDPGKRTDSLIMTLTIRNLGMAIHDSILVRLNRRFPNGDSLAVVRSMIGPYFEDSVTVRFSLDFARGIGLNHFDATVDYLNRVPESLENNNSISVDLFVPGGDIAPVYPYEYAVIPASASVVLKASTTDPFALSTAYRLQLDTSNLFTAPVSTVIVSKGGVIEWPVALNRPDSTVYFWRVSRDSVSASDHFAWRASSFQTIGDRHGWAQSHFGQFSKDAYRYVSYDAAQRKFAFQNNLFSVFASTGVDNYVNFYNIAYFLNTLRMSQGWGCVMAGWNIAVFDSISGQPQQVTSLNPGNPGLGQYNNYVCVGTSLNYYSFGPVAADNSTVFPNWQNDLLAFLNAIPANDHVLAYTLDTKSEPSNTQASSYSNALYAAFESVGAKSIRTLSDTVPYISFGRKGMTAGQGHDIKGDNIRSFIQLSDSFRTRWNSGYVLSEKIGPSYGWHSLHWRVQSLDPGAGDTVALKVIGVKADGTEDTLKTLNVTESDVPNLDQIVDVAVYPYLRLAAFMRDNAYRTSPQLKRWQVLYDEAPECAINPLKGFASVNDTLQEGDQVVIRFPIENVGTKPFTDSLVVTYWIEDNMRNRQNLPHHLKPPPFQPGQVIIDTLTVNSYQLKGNNGLWIFVNPLGDPDYQKEQLQFNNVGRFPFTVNSDVTNPLLDVMFDGVRILDGDIVSAKPTILVSLRDENKFLALNDTSAFTIYLQSPGGNRQRIYFAQGLEFTPAVLPNNSARILYRPTLTVDGRYALTVQARDRSRNASGAQDYVIHFEVDNTPSVTQVMNYPNPFSTSTRFVFTLTGSEVPEVFTIEVLTITGKVVRDITRSELGHIHIGRNITEYSWDGRDQFGDRLGNGVYLYRVITRLNGQTMRERASGADQFITHDFGKMVIMR